MDESPILIGRISRKRGNKGEVIVQPAAHDPSRFLELERILLDVDKDRYAAYEVEDVWFHGDRTVLKLKGVDCIGDAERIVGCGIYVPDAEKIELPEGTYFHHDLIGMDVVDETLGHVGRVAAIVETKGADLLEIEGERGTILVPAVKEICVEIDLGRRRVRVDLTRELVELNEV